MLLLLRQLHPSGGRALFCFVVCFQWGDIATVMDQIFLHNIAAQLHRIVLSQSARSHT